MTSVLVVAPDVVEAKGLIEGFISRGVAAEEVRIGNLDCVSLPSIDVLLGIGGNGKAQYGVQAQYLIDRCTGARLLMCVGAAGRLTDEVQIGDLVVATATIEHDYKERFNPRPLPRYDGDAGGLADLVRVAASRSFPFNVHFGPVASGDEDIVDPVRAAELRSATNALCVAWEGSGGARAARLNGIGFLEIRGVTDAADARAGTSFHENVGSVMVNLVDFLLAWCSLGRGATL